MPKSRVNCPNCRQPIVADVNQLFDVGVEPQLKQIVLSGMINIIQCPQCGYQGNLATPICYHDPEKELLLTYFPAELGLPVNEQERIIGPLINKVMNSLPQEKRKAYLLRPQTMLTLQGLVEKVLEADGITKEMLQEQQKRLSLLQRLLGASDDVIDEILKTDDQLCDESFFVLLGRLAEMAAASGDRDTAQKLADLQQKLLSKTTFGKAYQAQAQEIEAAVKSLQDAGKNLSREKLLELLVQAPTETRLGALVSFARPVLDYSFFQMLTERIDREKGENRQKLLTLREQLLEITQRIDKEVESRKGEAQNFLNELLKSEDIEEATRQNLQAVDNFFMERFEQAMNSARQKGNLDLITKLSKIQKVIEEASAPSQEMTWIEELLNLEQDELILKEMQENRQNITPEFVDTLANILGQIESSADEELAQKAQKMYQWALRISMEANLSN
jgi:hypothetical protein